MTIYHIFQDHTLLTRPDICIQWQFKRPHHQQASLGIQQTGIQIMTHIMSQQLHIPPRDCAMFYSNASSFKEKTAALDTIYTAYKTTTTQRTAHKSTICGHLG